jgi:hypothetical protein
VRGRSDIEPMGCRPAHLSPSRQESLNR